MTRTIVGVFDDIAETETVVKELAGNGVPKDGISVVTHRAKCGPSIGPVDGVTGGWSAGSAPAVGGAAGFMAGMVALTIPGIGPILAVGPLAAGLAGGGVGTVAGGILGRLKGMGVSDDDAGCYCEAVRRGGILLSVEVPDDKAADAAERIIGEHRLVDLDDCATAWRDRGWKGFSAAEGSSESSPARGSAKEDVPEGLPFDPESLRPSVRREKRASRAVRSYFRVAL